MRNQASMKAVSRKVAESLFVWPESQTEWDKFSPIEEEAADEEEPPHLAAVAGASARSRTHCQNT